MTKEDILKIAKEVNLPYFWESGMPCNLEALEAFAKLVAKKALETKDEPVKYRTIEEWIEHNPNHIGAMPIEVCRQIWGTK